MIINQIIISKIFEMVQSNMLLRNQLEDLRPKAVEICQKEVLLNIASTLKDFNVYDQQTYVDCYESFSNNLSETAILLRKLKPELYQVTPQIVEIIATAVEKCGDK